MLAMNKSYKQGELILSESPLSYALHGKASSQFCAECLKSREVHPLLRCSKCKYVFYCSKNCQKSHWTLHKKECSFIARSNATPGATLRVIFHIITSKVFIFFN